MATSRNIYKQLLKDTGVFAIGNFGTRVLSILLVPLYTTYLNTAEYGVADIIMTTVSLLMPLLTLSVAEASLRFLIDKDAHNSDVIRINFSLLIVSFFLSFIAIAIIGAFVPILKQYSSYFILIFFLTAAETSLGNISKGLGKTKVFAFKGILYTLIFAVSNILMLTVFKMGLDGYFASFIVAHLITCIYLFVRTKLYKISLFKSINKKLLVTMLRYSVPFIPSVISWWINSSFDKYMLLWLVGASANGIYSATQKIPTIITAVTNIFTQALHLSAMANYKEKNFEDFFSNVFFIIHGILLIGFCCILVCNKYLSALLLKKEFYLAWKYIPMITLSAVLSTTAGFLATAFTSAKKTNVLFISTTIGAVVNVACNYFLIKYVGILGAAIATAISFIVTIVIRLHTLKRILTLRVNMPRYYISIGILFISSILVAYMPQYYVIAGITFALIIILNYREMWNVVNSILHNLSKQ